jgi:hypothetical protein
MVNVEYIEHWVLFWSQGQTFESYVSGVQLRDPGVDGGGKVLHILLNIIIIFSFLCIKTGV